MQFLCRCYDRGLKLQCPEGLELLGAVWVVRGTDYGVHLEVRPLAAHPIICPCVHPCGVHRHPAPASESRCCGERAASNF